MSKRFFIYLFIFLLVVVAGATYLFNASRVRQGNLWQMLPNTPALVLQTDHAGVFFDKISKNNEIWEALKQTRGFSRFRRQFLFADSLISARKTWREQLRTGTLFAAVYPGKDQFLFLLANKKLPRIETLKNQLEDALGKGFVVLYEQPGNFPVTVVKIFNTTSGKSCWLWKMDGALLLTTQENLMQASISGYTMQEMHFSDSPAFKTVAQTRGKLADARLYVYYPALGQILTGLVSPHFSDLGKNVTHFAGWGETEIIISPQELVFSGYTQAGKGTFLAGFASQKPVTLSGYTLFPFNTTFSFSKGFSNFQGYSRESLPSKFKPAYRKSIQQLINLTGNEVSLVSNALNNKELPRKTWVVIQMKDQPAAGRLLNRLSLQSGSRQVFPRQGHLIRKINIKNFLPNLYGKEFSLITQNYYCLINGYAVFGNSPDALANLIRYSETGKTLDLDENYKLFSNHLATRSNYLAQIRPRALLGFLPYFFNPSTEQALAGYLSFLKNIQGIALQFNRDGNLFYTNFYLRYNNRFREENLALWKTPLGAPVVGKPFLVKDHRTNKYNIIVFDRANRMYLIDRTGKILWKQQLPEPPMSAIYPVDYYKNGKTQFLFNTKNFLFLFDRNGRYVAGYPIAIHPQATNGLSLFDYTRRKDYRILLAQADKRVYDYKINGNQVSGWHKPQMQAFVSQKVVRLLANHKDYIIINDDANHVKIVNRRGQQRIYLKNKVNKARHSTYFVNKTNNKGIILTTNTSGKLVYITTSGNLRFTDFGNFSPDHYFLYDDFNGDGNKDFIFVDKNKLKVFDRFKKLLFSYTFDQNITVQPEFFTLGNRQKVLGIVVSKEKTIYLFDSKGNILINHGLTGETPFTVGSLNNNREVNIITATGNTLYNYRIK